MIVCLIPSVIQKMAAILMVKTSFRCPDALVLDAGTWTLDSMESTEHTLGVWRSVTPRRKIWRPRILKDRETTPLLHQKNSLNLSPSWQCLLSWYFLNCKCLVYGSDLDIFDLTHYSSLLEVVSWSWTILDGDATPSRVCGEMPQASPGSLSQISSEHWAQLWWGIGGSVGAWLFLATALNNNELVRSQHLELNMECIYCATANQHKPQSIRLKTGIESWNSSKHCGINDRIDRR